MGAGGGAMILVIHSTFIDLLLKALMRYPHSGTTGTVAQQVNP